MHVYAAAPASIEIALAGPGGGSAGRVERIAMTERMRVCDVKRMQLSRTKYPIHPSISTLEIACNSSLRMTKLPVAGTTRSRCSDHARQSDCSSRSLLYVTVA